MDLDSIFLLLNNAINFRKCPMKRYITLFTAFLLACTTTISAQSNIRTGYFLDGFMYKYKLNPAMAGERGFIALPGIGNVVAGVEGNVAVSDFIYPLENGRVGLFLHPNIPDRTFLENLPQNVITNIDVNTNILGVGFWAGKSYHTIDLSASVNASANLPDDMFRFIKVGAADGNSTYDFTNLGMKANSRLELAYGYSRSIGDNFRIGVRLKMLVGVAVMETYMDKMTLSMGKNKWTASANGTFAMAVPGLEMQTKGEAGTSTGMEDQNYLNYTFNEINPNEILMTALSKPNLGFAADIGFAVDFLEYCTLSASVVDLGILRWKTTTVAQTPSGNWEYTGFDNLSLNSSEGSSSISDQLSDITDELMQSFNFKRLSKNAIFNQFLSMTAHLGFEFRMPFYERMVLGVMGSHRFDGAYSWTEGRASLSLAPARWFSIAGNYAYSTFGHSVGAALNIHLPGFNLYAGVDSIRPIFAISPQMIPLNDLNTKVSLGLTFPFGRYHGRYKKHIAVPETTATVTSKEEEDDDKDDDSFFFFNRYNRYNY